VAGVIWGVALALAVGAIMGLSGAGGSILTVPILVYVVGVDAVTATAYSLFVVGVTSTVGAASYWRRGLVNVRAAVAFSIPSLVVVFFTRSVLVPAIPAQLGTVAGMAVSKDLFILVLFAVIMALAALSMIAKPRYRLSLTEPPGPAGEPRAPGSRVAGVTERTRPLTGHGVDGFRSGPAAARSGTGWAGTAVPRSAGAAEAPEKRDARRAGAKAEAGRATEPRTAPGQGPAGTGPTGPVKVSVPLAALEGTVIGVFTGVVGAGGGFAIVPALVVLSRLPMRVAVGTSLTIIAAKSLAGFAGDVALRGNFDWGLLLAFTALAVVGILAGSRLGRHVPGDRLRPAFGWFVLVAAAGILVRELLLG